MRDLSSSTKDQSHAFCRRSTFFFKKIFIWLHQVLLAALGIFIAYCGALVAARGLLSRGVHGLSCSRARMYVLSRVRLFATPPLKSRQPGSSDHGIFQARILDWVAFPPKGNLPDPGIEPISRVSCIDRQLLNHWTTREVPQPPLNCPCLQEIQKPEWARDNSLGVRGIICEEVLVFARTCPIKLITALSPRAGVLSLPASVYTVLRRTEPVLTTASAQGLGLLLYGTYSLVLNLTALGSWPPSCPFSHSLSPYSQQVHCKRIFLHNTDEVQSSKVAVQGQEKFSSLCSKAALFWDSGHGFSYILILCFFF